ncbi:negative regulator of mitosis [Venturia nashicola]|uniref:Negative regulator of mitosis n=1 Tax=Venturia nashicola TaxID=86259 RepID=A0A4Z1NZD4_9PEZI|nr:negative regulator of mitosis [Venturia nashicola]TLD19993.1 negative regulator of mitosis [Venturia nashicola]
MAQVRSLGLHTPSGLPYLIREGLLPSEPHEDSYTWETYNESDGHEEVLTTDQCVVWSRGGVVRKAFTFDVEKERVQQAILTWFPSDDHLSLLHWKPKNDDANPKPTKRQRLLQSSGQNRLSRALVVFLNHQAHIYFISGASHVINLHFEVERAFPSPRGLIIQRKLPADVVPTTPILGSRPGMSGGPTPYNSFASPFAARQSHHDASFRRSSATFGKFASTPKGPETSLQLNFDLLKRSKSPAADSLPRHFCLTNPLSEFGLVVHAPSEPQQKTSHPVGATSEDLESLNKEEEIIYVSPTTEVADEDNAPSPLTLVVTLNQNRRIYSVWQAMYADSKPLSSLSNGKKTTTNAKVRRRSSFVTTGATTTPAVRGVDKLRESLGPSKRIKKVPQLNASQSTAQSEANDEDLMVSQLDPDFEARQPAKESRRVSGMLSRADLSTSFDRSAFQELASQRVHGRTSLGPSGRRGVSLGGPNDRSSLGIGAHRKLRSSTPGAFARLSLDESSALGLGIDGEDSTMTDNLGDLDDIFETHAELDAFDFQQPFGGLRKEILVTKFAEIPMSDSVPLKYSFGSVVQTAPSTIKVFTVTSPRTSSEGYHQGQRFFLHIMNRESKDHVQVEYSVRARQNPRDSTPHSSPVPIAICRTVTRLTGHLDVMKMTDNKISRVLCLEEKSGHSRLRLYAPWSPETSSEVFLDRLRLSNPYGISSDPNSTPSSAGKQRTVDCPRRMVQLLHPDLDGSVSLRDIDDQLHRIQIQLGSHNDFISKIFELCLYVLPAWTGDLLMSVWWIQHQDSPDGEQREWNALMEAIFIVALSLDEDAGKRRRHETPMQVQTKSPAKPHHPPPADAFTRMMDIEQAWNSSGTWSSPAWSWTVDSINTAKPLSRHRTATNAHILTAREFVKSPKGQDILRPLRSNPDIVQLMVSMLLTTLHLFREEQKLDCMAASSDKNTSGDLTPILAQLGRWLGWPNWDWKAGQYYGYEMKAAAEFGFEDLTIRAFTSSSHLMSTGNPPSIYAWLEQAMSSTYHPPFPSLDAVVQQPVTQNLRRASAHFFPRSTALGKYFINLRALDLPAEKQVEAIVEAGITAQMLDTFPEAVFGIINEGIVKCQGSPPTTWTLRLLELVGRDDLTLLAQGPPTVSRTPNANPPTMIKARKDLHSLCISADKPGVASTAHPETDRMTISRLIFHEDRRFIEALRIIEPLRVAVAECIPDPSWSETQLLDAQKEVVKLVMARTFALAPGQGMAHFNSRKPFPTENYEIHGYNTSCVMKPSGNTVSADRTSFTEEKYGWAWFHAGVAAGLGISRQARGIDTSWILFNKPPELTVRHAGLLLALGLNGHLKNVAKVLCFKYLTPKHSMTSIGLLLGLAASNLGSMDTLVTRLLSVHVTRLLPPGAAELNITSQMQTAGLIGIGLLYYNTQHRRMSEIMLSEIETTESDDSTGGLDTLRDESYRLAAGLSLGFINLGQGNTLKGMQDMQITERLLVIAMGSRPVDMVHILDRATAGATIAIALIFMKTGNKAVARKIDVPDTLPQFDYIRPDILLLRTLAKHLILWNDIKADHDFIIKNLPSDYAKEYPLQVIKSLRSQHMPLYNILTGLLWSISLRYAGSGNLKVRDFLIEYLDCFIKLCKIPALRYDAKLTRNTVRNCQDLLALSCATVMAGTGDLDVMRRLRLLHGRANADTPFGSHLAAHMALGTLFLGGGNFTFGTSNLAIASLICAFYPLFPMDVTDNNAHLQPLRHFWVLAAESRCIITRDVDTNRAIRIPLTVRLKDGTSKELTAPCLLPELESINQIETSGKEYWPIILDFANNKAHFEGFKENQTLFVRRRGVGQGYHGVFPTTLISLNDAEMDNLVGARKIFASIFELPIFKNSSFELSDVGLVIPKDTSSGDWTRGGRCLVDDKLTLVRAATKSTDRDLLWNLRVLFQWAEGAAERGDGAVKWLGMEVITQLRGMIGERGRKAREGDI